jgi:hypothetical protein
MLAWPIGVEEGPVGALPVSRAHNAPARFRSWRRADLHARLYLDPHAYARTYPYVCEANTLEGGSAYEPL